MATATHDEADALACVLCAILIAEQRTLERLDATDPPVLFPPRELWDTRRLPPAVLALGWKRYDPGPLRPAPADG